LATCAEDFVMGISYQKESHQAKAAAESEWDQMYVPIERLGGLGVASVTASKLFPDLNRVDITFAEAVCYASEVESTKYVGVLLEL